MPRALTFLQVEDLYDEVLSNAWHLSRDAERLLEAASVGHARALATLALEECGKAILIHEAKVASFQRGLADPVLDDAFWIAWRSHRPKLRAVRDFVLREEYWFGVAPPPFNELLFNDVDAYLVDLDRWAAEGDTSKLRGLYVDIDHGTGSVLSPATDERVDEVGELLAIAHQIGWQLRLGDHIKFIASVRPHVDPKNLYSAYADGGALARSRGGRGWEAQADELMLMMKGFDRQDAASDEQ